MKVEAIRNAKGLWVERVTVEVNGATVKLHGHRGWTDYASAIESAWAMARKATGKPQPKGRP